jgi:rhodanese-related sulfurtransferase
MAGFIAAGLLRGDHPQVAPDQLASQPLETLVVDVRTSSEHAQGKIPGSVNIPIDELRDRLDEIPRDRRVVVHCQVGMRGYLATRILLQAGRVTANLSGGYQSYRQFFPS